MQKKINSSSQKQQEISDFVDLLRKKIAELRENLDEIDKANNTNINRVEARINNSNKYIASIQTSLANSSERFIQIEKDVQNSKDQISQLESSVSNLSKLREEDRLRDQNNMSLLQMQLQNSYNENPETPESSSNESDQNEKKSEEITERKEEPKKPETENKFPRRSTRMSIISDFSFPNPSFIENTAQELKKEIANLKETLIVSARDVEQRLTKQVANSIKTIEEKVIRIKDENQESFKEVHEKNSLFPVNVGQIAGMSQSEARLFTLEARLRSEENSRIKAFNFLGKLIEGLRASYNFGAYQDRVLTRDKRETPDRLYTAEVLKKFGEHDRKYTEYKDMYSNLVDGSIHEETIGLTRKYRTPRNRDYPQELSAREAKSSSVTGRRNVRKSLN